MLENKVVVVTGAGGGLGKALVHAFIAEGSRVIGIVRSPASLEELSTIKGAYPYIADVSNPQVVNETFKELIKVFGGVDFLFNNAAVYPKVNFLEESGQDYLDAVAVNLGGIANCCKAVLPTMIANNFGRIYNLGSFADIRPIANSAAYSSSKGGVHSLTKAIAADIVHLEKNVEVHEWIPGHLNTRMSDFTGLAPSQSAQWAVDIASGRVPASKKSTLFENNREWLPPKSLKQRLMARLLFWK